MQRPIVAAVLLLAATQTLGAPTSKEPIVLFSCPANGLCYASPRNCFDNCNAAFSMRSENGSTTYNITMMSPLSYTALLIKEQGSEKYDKAIICSFHTARGIVARVNYPNPIVIQPFVQTTEPEGHTDSTYTQCATKVSEEAATKARYKLISGKWESELILDENLAIDVVPAVENARVMSDSQKIEIPPSRVKPTRANDDSNELDEKLSEAIAQRRQFEKKAKEISAATEEKKKKLKVVEDEDVADKKEKSEEVKPSKEKKLDVDDSEELALSSRKESKGKTDKGSKGAKKLKEDDDEDDEYEKDVKKTKEEKNLEGRPKYRDYDDEGEEHDEHDEDPDHASGLCVLTSLALSLLLSIYRL